MTPSSPVLRVVSTTASAAVLALSAGPFFPGGQAAADSPEPTPATASASQAADKCLLLCLPVLGEDSAPTETVRPLKAKEPAAPPAQPAAPAPGPPDPSAGPAEPPAQTAPAPAAPSGAPEPEETDPGQAAPEATTPGASPTPSNGPTSTSNWDTPVTRSATATQVAAVSGAGDPGADAPALLPIMAGVLLVGAAGAAFAWWGRNRIGAH
ncbi:hypothetical protein [Arthrobacter sp. ZGTC412]|uniref:hypothetical protein n=1 Tax=Arthrobacter sp. ZGTC412 TaxID=2058900 RepID=UPI000CE39DBD|nr:hypothetical protein [Arthrobacter sp. ZGTC412]